MKTLLTITLLFLSLSLYPAEKGKLPQKAKLEAIIFNKSDIVGLGYVYKKQFVENQEIVFWRLPDSKSYRLKKRNGDTYLLNKNKERESLYSLRTLAKGIYFIKGDRPYIKGKYFFSENSFAEGVFIFYNEYNDGNTVLATEKKSSYFRYIFVKLERYQINRDQINISGCEQGNNLYSLNAGFPGSSKILKLESTLSKENVEMLCKGNKSTFELFSELPSVTLTYRNGDVFRGQIRIQSNKIIPSEGEYKYATGETFIGKYQDIYFDWDRHNGRIVVPSQGKTIFADNSVAEGDWLEKYDFSEDIWKEIYKSSVSLTDIRNKAINKKRILDYEKRLKEQKEEQNKKEEERKKQIREQYLVSKYGKRYGKQLAQSKIELGMTLEMVNEVYPKDWFDCDESAFLFFKTETWTFNETKMMMNLAAENAKEGVVSVLAVRFFKNMFGISAIPQYLEFENGKLVNIVR